MPRDGGPGNINNIYARDSVTIARELGLSVSTLRGHSRSLGLQRSPIARKWRVLSGHPEIVRLKVGESAVFPQPANKLEWHSRFYRAARTREGFP